MRRGEEVFCAAPLVRPTVDASLAQADDFGAPANALNRGSRARAWCCKHVWWTTRMHHRRTRSLRGEQSRNLRETEGNARMLLAPGKATAVHVVAKMTRRRRLWRACVTI